MRLKIFILMTILVCLTIVSFVSAHTWGFDPSYKNYTLNYTISYNSGTYKINATFVLCRNGASWYLDPTWYETNGTYWCSGNTGKCCGGGINETTKECNVLPCFFAYQKTCSIFGSSSPIFNCYAACESWLSYGGNMGGINYTHGTDIKNITNHPFCANYADKYAWQETKTFETTSLDNFIISAGFAMMGPGGTDPDGYDAVPIFIRPEAPPTPSPETHTCSNLSQIILRLSQATNAHGEVYNGAGNYPIEICYNHIFGFAGNGDRTCHGNKVLGLSSNTNAHAQIPSKTTYSVPVCYGNLVCINQTTNCTEPYKLVVSLSADTNAHLSNSSDYPIKICCKPFVVAGDRYWADMENVRIGRDVNKSADVLDTVEMVWRNTGLPEGERVSFEIYEDDILLDDNIRTGNNTITGIVNSEGNAVGLWTITPEDLAKTSDLDGFFFKVNNGISNYLTINRTETNEMPEALIIKPEAGRYLVNSLIDFEQASHDKDDALEITWDFGDRNSTSCDNLYAGSGVNCNTTHSYATWGVKTIVLTASEVEREQEDRDAREIYLYDEGINVFALISEPPLAVDGYIINGTRNVHFRANESFVANCSYAICPGDAYGIGCYDVIGEVGGVDKNLHCFDYPKTGNYGIGKTTGKYNLWFNWTFDQGPGRYGNWIDNYTYVVDFNREFIDSISIHRAWLRVGYETF